MKTLTKADLEALNEAFKAVESHDIKPGRVFFPANCDNCALGQTACQKYSFVPDCFVPKGTVCVWDETPA